MPPCFPSPACATAQNTSNDATAAAHACTLRMLLSLEISASSRADFLERYHGGGSAQPASAYVDIGPSDYGSRCVTWKQPRGRLAAAEAIERKKASSCSGVPVSSAALSSAWRGKLTDAAPKRPCP